MILVKKDSVHGGHLCGPSGGSVDAVNPDHIIPAPPFSSSMTSLPQHDTSGPSESDLTIDGTNREKLQLLSLEKSEARYPTSSATFSSAWIPHLTSTFVTFPTKLLPQTDPSPTTPLLRRQASGGLWPPPPQTFGQPLPRPLLNPSFSFVTTSQSLHPSISAVRPPTRPSAASSQAEAEVASQMSSSTQDDLKAGAPGDSSQHSPIYCFGSNHWTHKLLERGSRPMRRIL